MTAEGGGMTSKEFPKSEEKASELIANAEQILRGEPSIEDIDTVYRLLAEARVRVAAVEQDTRRLVSAIRWALGEEGDFAPQEFVAQGKFYWRSELRARAGLRTTASHNSGSGAALGAIPQEEPPK